MTKTTPSHSWMETTSLADLVRTAEKLGADRSEAASIWRSDMLLLRSSILAFGATPKAIFSVAKATAG